MNRKHAAELGFREVVEDWLQLDVCDMSVLAAQSFDAVVCYGGPLSYVFEQREHALQECLRVLQPDGVFVTSVMSLWGTIHEFLGEGLNLPAENNRLILRTGDLTVAHAPRSTHHCHLFRAEEFRQLFQRHSLEVVAMSASNALSTQWGEALERSRKVRETWELILEMELEACAQPGYLDGGTHLIAVARKKANLKANGSSPTN